MAEEKIYSKNAKYQKFEVLKTNRNKRYRYGEFFVEGVRNINMAIRNGWRFSSLIYSDEMPLSNWAKDILRTLRTDVNYVLPAGLMRELSGKEDTSELLAVVKMREDRFEEIRLSERPTLVLFDRPSNRGNLGTLIRSCDAFGVDGIILTGHAVDLYDPEVIIAGMGSFFNVPVIRIARNEDVEDIIRSLRARYPGFQTIATTAHRQSCIYQTPLSGPCLLMVGNETEGLCRGLYELADTTVSIPMAETSSASSFNVACAATVMLSEIVRQRMEKDEAER